MIMGTQRYLLRHPESGEPIGRAHVSLENAIRRAREISRSVATPCRSGGLMIRASRKPSSAQQRPEFGCPATSRTEERDWLRPCELSSSRLPCVPPAVALSEHRLN